MAFTWTKERKENAIKLIFDRISDGESVRGILNNERDKKIYPSRILFNEWIDSDENLAIQYVRACEDRADKIFEEILDIADETSNDVVQMDIDGIIVERTNHEVIQRSRLRVDARKWMLGKMQPKKYGDSSSLDITSKGDKIDGIIELREIKNDN